MSMAMQNSRTKNRNRQPVSSRGGYQSYRRESSESEQSNSSPIRGLYRDARTAMMMCSFMGTRTLVKTRNGSTYKGHTIGFSDMGDIALTDAKLEEDDNSQNPSIPGLIIPKNSFVVCKTNGVDLKSLCCSSTDFTDSGIVCRMNGSSEAAMRELQPWLDDDALDVNSTLSLDDANDGWDSHSMFQANRDKFNLQTTYNEDLHEYTTKLPDPGSVGYEERERFAQKQAEEIEQSEAYQNRIAKELGNGDEEDQFSAVQRPGESNIPHRTHESNNGTGKNVYTIPALRADGDQNIKNGTLKGSGRGVRHSSSYSPTPSHTQHQHQNVYQNTRQNNHYQGPPPSSAAPLNRNQGPAGALHPRQHTPQNHVVHPYSHQQHPAQQYQQHPPPPHAVLHHQAPISQHQPSAPQHQPPASQHQPLSQQQPVVSQQQSPISQHQSPIPHHSPMSHQSPVSQHQPPLSQQHQPPISQQQPLISQHPSPMSQHQPPVSQQSHPSQQHQPPSQQHLPPSSQHQSPLSQHQPPAAHQQQHQRPALQQLVNPGKPHPPHSHPQPMPSISQQPPPQTQHQVHPQRVSPPQTQHQVHPQRVSPPQTQHQVHPQRVSPPQTQHQVHPQRVSPPQTQHQVHPQRVSPPQTQHQVHLQRVSPPHQQITQIPVASKAANLNGPTGPPPTAGQSNHPYRQVSTENKAVPEVMGQKAIPVEVTAQTYHQKPSGQQAGPGTMVAHNLPASSSSSSLTETQPMGQAVLPDRRVALGGDTGPEERNKIGRSLHDFKRKFVLESNGVNLQELSSRSVDTAADPVTESSIPTSSTSVASTPVNPEPDMVVQLTEQAAEVSLRRSDKVEEDIPQAPKYKLNPNAKEFKPKTQPAPMEAQSPSPQPRTSPHMPQMVHYPPQQTVLMHYPSYIMTNQLNPQRKRATVSLGAGVVSDLTAHQVTGQPLLATQPPGMMYISTPTQPLPAGYQFYSPQIINPRMVAPASLTMAQTGQIAGLEQAAAQNQPQPVFMTAQPSVPAPIPAHLHHQPTHAQAIPLPSSSQQVQQAHIPNPAPSPVQQHSSQPLQQQHQQQQQHPHHISQGPSQSATPQPAHYPQMTLSYTHGIPAVPRTSIAGQQNLASGHSSMGFMSGPQFAYNGSTGQYTFAPAHQAPQSSTHGSAPQTHQYVVMPQPAPQGHPSMQQHTAQPYTAAGIPYQPQHIMQGPPQIPPSHNANPNQGSPHLIHTGMHQQMSAAQPAGMYMPVPSTLQYHQQ